MAIKLSRAGKEALNKKMKADEEEAKRKGTYSKATRGGNRRSPASDALEKKAVAQSKKMGTYTSDTGPKKVARQSYK